MSVSVVLGAFVVSEMLFEFQFYSFPGLLKDIPNPESVLTSVPISHEDLGMIRSMVQKANVAVAEIKVKHTENLVVPFRIP